MAASSPPSSAAGPPDRIAATAFAPSTGHGTGSSARDEPAAIPETLGGYRVIKPLGQGGMGVVYLARQLSLDRNVALKVMMPRWADDPTFVARFTREAYAAAQLVHHNIVQIYDFGEQEPNHYFSMEFVDGQTLARVLEDRGKLEPEVAVGYILQAIRGLKFAHDQGMVHRDIKPDNLMLDRHGVVKVADLGLVKVPGQAAEGLAPAASGPDAGGEIGAASTGQVTRADVAMGTPAFMAPEQARDAAHVDARADIYSLGCTLYALVTGRPPFQGKTVLEILSKHASEPVVPPDLVVEHVPGSLSAIVLKMVAKDPDARYSDLGAVIEALEGFLRGARAEAFTPREEEAQVLEQCARAYHSSPSARRRTLAALAGAVACGAGLLLALLAGRPQLAGAVLGLGILTPAAYATFEAIRRRTPLFLRARQCLIESGPGERLAMAAGAVLLAVILLVAGVLWSFLAVALAAAALAAAAVRALGRDLDRERREPIERIHEVLKGMRRRGFDEEALRRFVAEHGGARWDAVHDALFGNEDRLIALRRWGHTEWDRARPRLTAWRDAALARLEAQLQARQQTRVRRYLQRIEELSLRAQGVSFFEARRKARRAAEAMVAQAGELRRAAGRVSRVVVSSLSSEVGRRRVLSSIREAAEDPESVLDSMERGLLARRAGESLDALIGPSPRFIAGAVLVLGWLLWVNQNGWTAGDTPSEPLRLPLVPALLTGVFRDSLSGIAGMILLASATYRGWRIGLLVIPAAAVALLGTTLGIPASLGFVVVVVLAVLGFLFGRERPEAEAEEPPTAGDPRRSPREGRDEIPGAIGAPVAAADAPRQ